MKPATFIPGAWTLLTAFFLTSTLLLTSTAGAQNASQKLDTAKTAVSEAASKSPKERKVTISGMMLGRYTRSFDDKVDINGKYHTGKDEFSTSGFSLRRVRVQAKAQINPRTDAAVLLNLTDFIGNPANKVLELATIKYRFSDYLNLQVGQFRPYFGREDLYPEELLQSFEWSNQYYAFGANGWQSFQMGATLFGKVDVLKIPVKYYLGMFNGNGRNQLQDNDNGKLYPARVELAVRPKTIIGLNGGVGNSKGNKIWALNADIDHTAQLGGAWELELQSEYKRGVNNSLFDTSTCANKVMKDYLLSGYYILPNLKYKINSDQVKSLELSMRYEHLNCDSKRDGSIRKTYMPMLSCQLSEENFLRFELGMIIDQYSGNVTPSKEHNNSRFVCQVQARF